MSIPSFLNIIVSTIALFVSLHFINKQLDELEIEKTAARKLLALTLATVVALCAGKIVDWMENKNRAKPAPAIKVEQLITPHEQP